MAEHRPIGPAIRSARAKQGMTMTALAKRAGVSKGYMSTVENGGCEPTLRMLHKIAEALEISPSALADGNVVDATDRAAMERLVDAVGRFLRNNDPADRMDMFDAWVAVVAGAGHD